MQQIVCLCCATDPGGAANVAPVAALFDRDQCHAIAVARTIDYFHRAGITALSCVNDDDDPEHLLDQMQPAVLLCGATRFVSPDRRLVQTAQRRGIRSVVILDEWYRYAERFDGHDAPLSCLPDAICVPDALALEEAVTEGVPADRLVITGSPALSALCDRLERFHAEPPPIPEVLRGGPRPWIVFLSETHEADFGSAPGARGRLGEFIGYTERSVAADLAGALSVIGRPCTLVDKRHPAADDDAAVPAVTAAQAWRRVTRAPLDALLWHADLVVGMRSMALLEAALSGRPVLSYQPGLLAGVGAATSERLGLVTSAATGDGLVEWLRAHWSNRARVAVTRPAFASAGAAARVLDVLMGTSPAIIAGASRKTSAQ